MEELICAIVGAALGYFILGPIVMIFVYKYGWMSKILDWLNRG
jgi:hypothetical protein